MKNIVLSAVAVLAMSSFAVAGGDIAPVEEPMVEVVEPVITDGGFYLGLAYGVMNASIDETEFLAGGDITRPFIDEDFSSIMLQAGYKINSYVAIEGRYWFGLDSDAGLYTGDNNIPADVNIDAWGIYVKPMYPVTDAFDIYALLGYAAADLNVDLANGADFESDTIDGFSWGIGAQYSINDSLGLFVDYVSVYDDTEEYIGGEDDATITSINFGVNYQF